MDSDAHRELLGDKETCGYLPRLRARMRYRVFDACPPATYEAMLERGWRRFGRLFFRPACTACDACRSLRVDVGDFRSNRSMRRTWNRNRDLRVVLARPGLSAEHMALYERYHEAQHQHRGWPLREVGPMDYYQSFVEGAGDYGYELRFFLDEELVAISLIDLLPRAVSAVYCYYDPDRRGRALGIYSALQHLSIARDRGGAFLYLGYWVEANTSMRYKARYRPNSLIEGRPEDHDDPIWHASKETS